MAFNTTSPTNGVTAVADLINTSIAAGYTPDPGLDQFAIVTSVVRQLLSAVPSGISMNNPAGGVSSVTRKVLAYSAIADNTATDTFTITVPNVTARATLKVTISSALGAGGAVGAGEASGTISYDVVINRFAGANAVGSVSSAYGSATALSAGAATITTTAALSAVAGAVGAVNTFAFRPTIARGSGSSTNHTCVILVEVINALAGGITAA
jgi:hypothetical protein